MRGLLFSLLCHQALKRQGRPSGLIGQYKPYLNSNDSPTRDILKDYSGQGHDIQLYNFGYALGSGYGKYYVDWTISNWYFRNTEQISRVVGKIYKDKIYIEGTGNNTINNFLEYKYSAEQPSVPSHKIKVTGINEIKNKYPDFYIIYKYRDTLSNNTKSLNIKNDGIYTLPETVLSDNLWVPSYSFANIDTGVMFENPITIEQIPDYPGALVSDGIDDYGLCENFPILTKEKGYTIVALRVLFDSSIAWISNSENSINEGAFVLEDKSYNITYNFGSPTGGIQITNNLYSFQTSKKYNDRNILIGNSIGSKFLTLFKPTKNYAKYSNIALYALEIYDHDLTDEEIESVKEAMYNEYLTATNALQNHIIADYECYDKTNEDEDRDVLKDLSGNGHDIQLYNFGFAEGSGYGLYSYDFINDFLFISTYGDVINKSNNKFTIKSFKYENYPVAYTFVNNGSSFKKTKIKVTNSIPGFYFGNRSLNQVFDLSTDGIYELPDFYSNADNTQYGFRCENLSESCNITIEQIPEYQGALVSDGVDDYGLCENFPILNKEDGFTILAIRKWIVNSKDSWFLTNRSAFLLEDLLGETTCINGSFWYLNTNDLQKNIFTTLTSTKYNDVNINKGEYLGGKTLSIFGDYFLSGNLNHLSSIAFYQMKILDKDCTTEEIKFLAKQMLAKHKEKTGETIELNF